ncbi:glucan biosynthesis protein [Haematobacter genomosp. 1]|uniref:Glucan biosynthesis protein D n=1 Tax=Haematobacter genomosp. 1 TaxID=366618 RepID=A0A212AG66_9RHOB|nr:glucan biosynthesis protein G [Haematobacter genomosp. 1]OWJ80481.1 glucan biosynthesis protein D [Haematobacter genomosp. 1]
MRRRQFLLTGLSVSALAAIAPLRISAQTADFFDALTQEMQALVNQPYQRNELTLPEPFSTLGYDGYRQVQADPARAIWAGQALFTLNAFSLGWLYDEPVTIALLEGGERRELSFTSQDFLYHAPLDRAPFDAVNPFPGIAGLKINYPLNSPEIWDELLTFLGASYFRALGQGSSYGTSARGIAIDTAAGKPEEFPRFTRFYVVPPGQFDSSITIYAQLEGPSVTGAYRFITRPGKDTTMDVTARIFVRRDVSRLGIAPLTSMFLYGGPNRAAFDDYRERVHDSEGLKIIRASGEEVWRNLNNPAQLAASFYKEENPRAFGLMQRSRRFEDYADAEAHYEKRPSVLVEPSGQWGVGHICLIEIPTKREVNDNIVCFWMPEAPATAGSAVEFSYRLVWGDIAESSTRFARVITFSSGHSGTSGSDPTPGERKFVVDFEGPYLDRLLDLDSVAANTSIFNGEFVHTDLKKVAGEDIWRFVADVKSTASNPVELSVYLSVGGRRLTETWSYQWRPGDESPH